jgi:hypothetical protein
MGVMTQKKLCKILKLNEKCIEKQLIIGELMNG